LRSKRKVIAILICLSFVMSLLVPMSALAYSINRVTSVPTLAGNKSDDVQFLGTLTLKEDADFMDDLVPGRSFTVTFPAGVKLQDVGTGGNDTKVQYQAGEGSTWEDLSANVTKSGDYTLDIELPDAFNDEEEEPTLDAVRIIPAVKIDGFDGGDIEVTVDGFDSGITSGTYVLGRVGEGDTTARVISVPTIGEEDPAEGGVIRITENSVGAIGYANQKITLKLPPNFEWRDYDIDFLAGLADADDYSYEMNARTLVIWIDPDGADPGEVRTQRGIIQITPYFVAKSGASYGEVEVSLDGDEISDADLVIAKYADYGISVASDGDAKEVLAGQIDAKLTKLYIKESIAGSLIDNRRTRIDLPKWAKIVDCKLSGVKGFDSSDLKDALDDAIDGTKNYVEFVIPEVPEASSSAKREFKVEFTVSLEANAPADEEIVAEVSGRSGAEGEAVLGTVLAPVTAAASESLNVRIGLKDQPIGDLTITEVKKGAIMSSNEYMGDYYGWSSYEYVYDTALLVVLPEGVEWSDTPDVEVVEGNLEIDEDDVDVEENVLYIPIKGESTKPSKIEITNAFVDLDRTVAEGPVVAKVQGSAVVENLKDASSGYDHDEDAGVFKTATVVSAEVARVATPAPISEKNVAVFTIGQSSYTLNNVPVAMDVAPYLKNDRTYLPIRYIANACGVPDDNILWNADDASVVLIKGDRVVKLVIGSNVMLINGVPFTMDVAPEIVDPGRTMLPLRWAAQALGATVEWDAATQSVTVIGSIN